MTVGVIVPDSPAAGLLAVGDVIEAVGGVNCHNDMNEVLKQIISAGDNVKLLVRRPALVTLLRHEVLLRAPDGTDAWGECSATLFNTRQLVLEPLSGRGTPHEVNVRSVVHLELQEAMFNLPPTLSVWTSGDEVIALRCEAPEHEGVRGGAAVLHAFYEELRQMVQSAEELGLDEGEPSLARQNTMVWQQGWLEMRWASTSGRPASSASRRSTASSSSSTRRRRAAASPSARSRSSRSSARCARRGSSTSRTA